MNPPNTSTGKDGEEEVDGDLVVEQVASETTEKGGGDEKASEKDQLEKAKIQSISGDGGAPGTATMVPNNKARIDRKERKSQTQQQEDPADSARPSLPGATARPSLPGSQKGLGLSRLSAKQLNVSGHSATSSNYNSSRRSLLRGIRKNSEMHLRAGPNEEEEPKADEEEEEVVVVQEQSENEDGQGEEEEEIAVPPEAQEEEIVLPPTQVAAASTIPMPPIMGMPQELPQVNRSTTRTSTTSEPGAQRIAGFASRLRQGESEHTITLGVSFRRPSHNVSGLIEATAVSREFSSTFIMEAQQVDARSLEARQIKEQKERQCRRVGYVLVAVSLLVLGLALGLGLQEKKEEQSLLLRGPTTSPSMAPSGFPSASPTGSLDLFLQGLPNSTLEKLNDISTPQWKAYDWLSGHPELPTMEEWRKTQLFVLVTFFYAFEGPHWRKEFRDEWLLYDTHECLWYSSVYGNYDEDIEGLFNQGFSGLDNCNENKEFQALRLATMFEDITDEMKPSVPPEIALLTKLVSLALPHNKLEVSLVDWLPSEVYQMPLNRFNLKKNSFYGPLPSELGLITTMSHLSIGMNDMTGTIPSQMFSLTNLYDMALDFNAFTGPLPSEVGLLTKLTRLYYYQMHLSGTIPTEVGLLTDMVSFAPHTNALTGPIPTEIGLMTSVTDLHLFNNSLSGTIITELLQLTNNLQLLYLFNNSLTGTIPSWFSEFTNATGISVKTNQLTGTIPSELALLPKVMQISLSNNKLTGTIPEEFATQVATASLRGFIAHGNQLQGTVPETLCLLGPCRQHPEYPIHCWGGLTFDCDSQLCGCERCTCTAEELDGGNATNETN